MYSMRTIVASVTVCVVIALVLTVLQQVQMPSLGTGSTAYTVAQENDTNTVQQRADPVSTPAYSSKAIVNNLVGLRDRPEPLENRAARIGPGTYTKIQEQIIELRNETISASIARLTSLNMYNWPGPMNMESEVRLEFPPVPTSGISDFQRVLSNRRFSKVFSELSKLSRQEAEDYVSGALIESMESYRGSISKALNNYKAAAETSTENGILVGLPRPLSDSSDGQSQLAGDRMSMFALATLAGELGLAGCRNEIDEFVTEALSGRNAIENAGLGSFLRADALQTIALSNRYVLAVAILGTLDSGNAIQDHTKSPVPFEWSMIELTAYDALRSPFDHPDQGIPVDYERGIFPISFPVSISEDQFQQLLEATGFL